MNALERYQFNKKKEQPIQVIDTEKIFLSLSAMAKLTPGLTEQNLKYLCETKQIIAFEVSPDHWKIDKRQFDDSNIFKKAIDRVIKLLESIYAGVKAICKLFKIDLDIQERDVCQCPKNLTRHTKD